MQNSLEITPYKSLLIIKCKFGYNFYGTQLYFEKEKGLLLIWYHGINLNYTNIFQSKLHNRHN